MPLTSKAFAKFIGDETDKWAKVIKSADIKPEEVDSFARTRLMRNLVDELLRAWCALKFFAQPGREADIKQICGTCVPKSGL
jgi:hypothetical protein